MIGLNPLGWEALQENPDQDYSGEGRTMTPEEARETLERWLAALESLSQEEAQELVRVVLAELEAAQNGLKYWEGIKAENERLKARVIARVEEIGKLEAEVERLRAQSIQNNEERLQHLDRADEAENRIEAALEIIWKLRDHRRADWDLLTVISKALKGDSR